MRRQTYRERTMALETIKFALDHGYKGQYGNQTARKHFYFTYQGTGSPEISVSWFDSNRPSVTVGNTTTDDARALERLKKFW